MTPTLTSATRNSFGVNKFIPVTPTSNQAKIIGAVDLEVLTIDPGGILYPNYQTSVFHGERVMFGKSRLEPKSFMLSGKAIAHVRGKRTAWIQEGLLVQEDCAEEHLSEDDDDGDYVLPNNVLTELHFISYWPTLRCCNQNPVMQIPKLVIIFHRQSLRYLSSCLARAIRGNLAAGLIRRSRHIYLRKPAS